MSYPTPNIPWIEANAALPNAATAQHRESELAGLVAAGSDLTAQRLKEAYGLGIFPWFGEGQPVLWWSPDPRMVLKPQSFKLHRSLKKTLHAFLAAPQCEIRIDSAFEQVMHHCAHVPRGGKVGSWIVPDMIRAYVDLHHAGLAHSIETWVDGELVGGLYCVALGHAVFGESMFALQTDASKIALSGLVALTKAQNVPWIDCQQNTRHLASLGAQEIDRSVFLEGIAASQSAMPLDWKLQPIHWQSLLSQSHPAR
jgi:leucyl/phenylalanyl-tRNA--protein transferase